MNNYLSHAEKEKFVQLIVMMDVVERVIEGYANIKSTDPGFLADIKRGRSFMKKAITKRFSFLTDDALKNLILACGKIEVMFFPKPEVRKAQQELLKLKTTLPMHIDDFYDWYSFVIDYSCISCTREDYEECPARRVLKKYDVFPFAPGAVGTCEYSYVQPEQGVGAVGEALLVVMSKTG